jgi:L-amino acid N-acyltransferase YncA
MITNRPATLVDIPQIRDINHWYIMNSISTFAITPPPVSHYEDILRDLMRRNLPFYVTVSDTRKSTDGADLVLGYAYLSPFRGHLLSYAPTVELAIFMRHDQQHFGYGALMLRKILGLVAQGVEHHCEEVVGDIPRIGLGGSRGVMKTSLIQNVIAVMAYDAENPTNGEKLRKWYGKWGFIEKGQLENVGRKMGRW